MNIKNIDIFCEVIDNFGDAGVVFRLAKELKTYNNNFNVRIFINRLSELEKINKKIDILSKTQVVDEITYILKENSNLFSPAELIIEAFGCEIPKNYYDKIDKSLIINLEYLTAEKWALDFHLKESLTGNPNIKKFFYMPGFDEKSGGLILDEKFLQKIDKKNKIDRFSIINKYIESFDKNATFGILFSYESDYCNLIKYLAEKDSKTILAVMGEKSVYSINYALKKLNLIPINNCIKYKNLTIKYIDFMEQSEFDDLLWCCDFAFVRGEESIVRAAIAGIPFIWHIYCQDEYAHMDKLNAFLEKFSEFSESKKIIEKYCNLVYNYNYRNINSLELEKIPDYRVFFEHLDEIRNCSNSFSRYLREKCSLIDKLFLFLNNEKF